MTGPPDSDLRVLIVAPNASSRFGGEAFLPLKYFQILKSRGYPAQLITHGRNREDLENILEEHQDAIHYLPDMAWQRNAWRIGRHFPGKIRDVVFNNLIDLGHTRSQARVIRRMVRDKLANVIHQPIPVSPRVPSGVHGFGVPVVIGPMNGGMRYPPGYEDHEKWITRCLVCLARWAARPLNLFIPGKRHAAALLVANARTRNALPICGHPNIIELVENGVDLSIWQPAPKHVPQPAGDTAFRFVFMGRLERWKAVDITLHAVKRARASGADVTLEILGDGQIRPELEALVRTLGLDDAVRFLGFRPQIECAAILARTNALILNSIRECGGAVVLEAMSLGLPVIGSAWGGPADYLDPGCGILVSPVPRADFDDRLCDAILRLARDPALCRRLGQAGMAKVRAQYDWERKVDRIVEIYRDVLTVE